MANLAPSGPVDALALPKVALQLLLIQTQQANHVIDLEKQIADLKNELIAKKADVIDRDGQITKLKSELGDLELVLKNNPRRPVVVRLPHGPPPQPVSLAPGPQSAHIRASSTSSIFHAKSDPVYPMEAFSSQLKGVTTEDGGLRGTRKAGQSLSTGATPVRSIRFQEIPYQIQRKIWRYSMPGPQVLELCKIDQMQSQQPGGPQYRLIGRLPAAFHTHQLSRIEILRAYSRLAKGKTTQNDEALIKRADDIDSYTDFKHDTVYIGQRAVRGTGKELLLDLKSWPLFNKVQYLAIDLDVCHLLAKMDFKFCDLLLHAKSLRELTIIFDNDDKEHNIWRNRLRVLDLLGLPQSGELSRKVRFGKFRRDASPTLVEDTTSKPTPSPAVSTTSTASSQAPVQKSAQSFLSRPIAHATKKLPGFASSGRNSIFPFKLNGTRKACKYDRDGVPTIARVPSPQGSLRLRPSTIGLGEGTATESSSPRPFNPFAGLKKAGESLSPGPIPSALPSQIGLPPGPFELSLQQEKTPVAPLTPIMASTNPHYLDGEPSNSTFSALFGPPISKDSGSPGDPRGPTSDIKSSTLPSLSPPPRILEGLFSNPSGPTSGAKRSASPSPAPVSNIFGSLPPNNKEAKPSNSPSLAPASNIFGSVPSNNKEAKPSTSPSPAPASNIFGSLPSNNKETKPSTSLSPAPTSNIFGSLPSSNKEAKPSTSPSPTPASNIFGSLPLNNKEAKPSTSPSPAPALNIFGSLPSSNKEAKPSAFPSPAPVLNIFGSLGSLPSNNKQAKPSTSPSPAPLSNIFGSVASNNKEAKPSTSSSPTPVSNIFGSLPSNNKEAKPSTSPSPTPESNIFGSFPSNPKSSGFDFNQSSKPFTAADFASAGSYLFGGSPSKDSRSLNDSIGTKHV